MSGLRYIRKKYRMSITNIAKMLNVSRQAVSGWEQDDRPIPQKRLEELSSIFSIPQEYFLKISDVQELELDKFLLDREIIGSLQPNEEEYLDSEGNTQSHTLYEPDPALAQLAEYNDARIRLKKLLRKIDGIISNVKYHDDDANGIALFEETERIDLYVQLFNDFANVASLYDYRGLFFIIVHALEVALGKTNGEWHVGKSRAKEGRVSNDDALVKILVEQIRSNL